VVVNIHVRSNGVVIAKNGQTIASDRQQDRVGAVEQAVDKAQKNIKVMKPLEGAVLASDGFFFPLRMQ
jgi:AICAR transformylase/IMP cyclohydrolase PurH